jgi:acyl-coenzyme A thioesterase PaaI-like protein
MASERRQLSDYYYPDPDEPGWHRWTPEAASSFAGLYGLVRVQEKGPGNARVRIDPQPHLNSSTGAIHGGAIAGFVDISIFAGSVGSGVALPDGAGTVELSVHYLTQAYLGRPIEAEVEVLRDGGRLVFVRGTIEQGEALVASYTALIRKNSPPRS